MQKSAVKDESRIKIGRLAQSRAYLDFCEEVYAHAFAAEGNADLYAEKLREVRLGTVLFETGRAACYLYIREADRVPTPLRPHTFSSGSSEVTE